MFLPKSRKLRTIISILLIFSTLIMHIPVSASEWENNNAPSTNTIDDSTSTKELLNHRTVSTQEELNDALEDKTVTDITIKTLESVKFVIPKNTYRNKTLTVFGSKITIVNKAIFKTITITNAKLFTESAKGNSITVHDKYLSLVISTKGAPKEVVFNRKGSESKLRVDGKLDQLFIHKTTILTIDGKSTKNIQIKILLQAKNSKIYSSKRVSVNSEADAFIELSEGAEKSTVLINNINAYVTVVNNTRIEITVVNNGKYKTIPVSNTFNSNSSGSSSLPTITPTPSIDIPDIHNDGGRHVYYKINFESNGGSIIEPMDVLSGNTITSLLSPQKNNNIFLGWYKDAALQNKFNSTSRIHSNITLYAKYSEVQVEEEIYEESFALVDQQSNLSFVLVTQDSSMNVSDIGNGIHLERMDSTEVETLNIVKNGTTFYVSSQNGFTEGASYLLTLTDYRINFDAKESSYRKCSFSIDKAESYNINFNENIIYIPSSDASNMVQNGVSTDALSIAVVTMNMDPDDSNVEGSFLYHGTQILNPGDTVCIYSGEIPTSESIDGNDSDFMDDDIAYITVERVSGQIGQQEVHYSESDSEDVLFTPDVLPIYVGVEHQLISYILSEDSLSGSLQIDMDTLDFSEFSDMGLSNETTIDKGDFIAFYTSELLNEMDESSITYGEINGIIREDDILLVTFQIITYEMMQETLNYYSKNDVDSNLLLEDVDIIELQRSIESDVIESGFAEDASLFLAALAMETDSFKNAVGEDYILDSMSISLDNPEELRQEMLTSRSSSKRVTLENLKVKASVGNNLQKLSGKGVRCAVTVSFDISIKTGDDHALVISVSATFIEEVRVTVSA